MTEQGSPEVEPTIENVAEALICGAGGYHDGNLWDIRVWADDQGVIEMRVTPYGEDGRTYPERRYRALLTEITEEIRRDE